MGTLVRVGNRDAVGAGTILVGAKIGVVAGVKIVEGWLSGKGVIVRTDGAVGGGGE